MKKIFLIFAIFLSLPARADFVDDLHARFPMTSDAKVSKAFGNFYSVVRGNEVLFINEDLTILINGDVQDLKTNRSLTTTLRDAARPKIKVADLDLKDAIRIGTGSQRIYVFSDPDCPYCKRLEGELGKLVDVEVYVFPFPITALHPDAALVAQDIWCSADRASAWQSYLLKGVKPAKGTCSNPLDRNIALSKKYQIFGTPAIIFEDGKVIPGAVPASTIMAQLATYKAK